MKKKGIPKPILKEMEDLDLNHCEEFIVDGITYYSLSLTDEDGTFMPIGQPIVFTIKDNAPIQLSEQMTNSILKKLDEE